MTERRKMVKNAQTNTALEKPYEGFTKYKIGHTTYIVKTKFNFTSESLNDIISRLISKEIRKAA